MPGAPVIETRGLRKSYRGTEAVCGLDLEVARGEIFALLGPNGAGKTTTVEICAGFRSYDAGTVRVLDTDPNGASADWRSRIGVVAQSANDLSDLSVREAVVAIAGCYRAHREPDTVIAAVGLADKRDTRCVKLSGGQRRRLDVALGMIGDPELLFLDEPTTGFDPQARRTFWDLIAQLRDDGTTILLTTHYLDEAEHLADRVGVIVGGRMVEVGPPAVIRSRHARGARVDWRDSDGDHTAQTATPTAFVGLLAERFDGEIPGLSITRPSLEDVYLDMIAEHSAGQPDAGVAAQGMPRASR